MRYGSTPAHKRSAIVNRRTTLFVGSTNWKAWPPKPRDGARRRREHTSSRNSVRRGRLISSSPRKLRAGSAPSARPPRRRAVVYPWHISTRKERHEKACPIGSDGAVFDSVFRPDYLWIHNRRRNGPDRQRRSRRDRNRHQ